MKIEKGVDWYEKGERPPVGGVVEVRHGGKWNQTKVIGYDDGDDCVVYTCDGFDHGFIYAGAHKSKFRPIKSEREKAIISACEIVDKDRAKSNINIDCSYAQKCAIEALVDAGWRPTND